ncbi:RNA-directed DNA polymerase, eukaryota [Tanacetum coccineum]|uniref:RNA-directed DNA polymerase, eukaryota n=1 Tax=Tanacetum coccineum TaxID=301880 RepID=A0ABQ5C5D9_9ASTR
MIRFKKKLQILKKEIRVYVVDQKKKQLARVNDLKSKLSDIDRILDQGGVNDDLLLSRMECMNNLQDVKAVDARDSIQKAKIQWAVEGDENSKFFHGIVNRKRANLAVKGIMIDGDWVDDPSRVKDEFRNHFAARFQDPGICHGKINFSFPNRLNHEQSTELESSITREEIRNAVWGCGENKSPGPDGFTFEFFRKFWSVVGPDFCTAVEWFFDHASFSIGCNSSFIALIPKSLDPKSVGDYRPISLIGIDFAKAYDSIRWDYLEDVLHSFGFGSKWRSWIRGCLNSGMASILVNGSPTSEFQFHRGLKQGDPLAPYLFILVMESLHLSFTRVIEAGIFTGVRIDPSTMISHLFYADDVVFIGEWSQDNLKVLNSMEAIRRNFFNGTQDDERKITWVKWTKALASKKQGGLGVSSFYALNRALLELSASHTSTWSSIVKEINILKTQGIDIISHCKIRVECTVADKMVASFTSSFRREVRGGAESLQLTQILDLLGTTIPIKVNIFAWKVSLDRLPTRSNLARRGVLVPSSSCLICNVSDEDLAHLLFRCDLAIEVTRLVYIWWNLVWITLDSYISWLSWIKALRMNSRSKSVLEGVFYTAWWSIWSYRNQILFSAKNPWKEVLFDDIVMRSFTWCIARSKNTFRWDSWLQHPYLLFL